MKDPMKFLNELNTKHKSIKSENQTCKTSITLLDTEVYIKNNKLYTKYTKKWDRLAFLNININNNSIPYSQTIRPRLWIPLVRT